MRAHEFDNPKDNFVEIFQKFLPLAMKVLELKSLPEFEFHGDIDSGPQPSFGMYSVDETKLYVALSNRHPNDILRTIAHELVHYKQDTEHKLNDESGSTGSPEENQANALAGVVMRNFNKQYPEYLKTKPIVSEGAGAVTFAGKDPNEFKSPKGGKPVIVVVTDQGSRYLITSDGMVLRHKSVHANTGGDDAGLQAWSDKIEFYDRSKPLVPGGMQNMAFPDAVTFLFDKGRIALSKGQNGERLALIADKGAWRPATIADAMPKAAAAKPEWGKIVIKADAGTWGTQPKLGWQPLDYNQRSDGTLNRVHNGSPVSHGAKVQQSLPEDEMLAKDLAETIRKVKGGKFRLVSKSEKNLGTYPSRAGAEKRERQVQYFKHVGEVSTKDLSMLSESEATDRAIKILKGIGVAASKTAKGAKGVVDAISAFGQSVMNGFRYAAGLAVGVGVITHPKEMWNAANFAWNFVTNPGHVTAVLGRTGLGGIPVIGDKWVNKDQAAEDLRKIMGNSTTSDVIFKLADLAVDNAIPIAGIIALLYGGKTFVDYLKKHNAIDTEKQEPTDTAQKIEKDKSIKENNKSQYIAALYVDEFADGEHWYVKGTPDMIQRFVQLANSLEDEAVKGTEYEPGVGMMAKIHKDLGDDSIPQWKIVPATNLEQIKPITGASLRALMTADLSDGAGEFMSDFLWNLEEKGQALVHDGSEQGVSESFDKEAEAWRDWQLKMLPRKMEMLSKLVKGWVPSEEDHIAAIEAGYDAMKNTGDVKDAAKAISDTFNEIQRQQGVAEGLLDRFKKKTQQPEDPSYKKGWELCNKDPSADPQFLFRKFGGGLDRNQFIKGFNDNAKSRGMRIHGDVSGDVDHSTLRYKEFKRDQGVAENFADGRNPQDKGDSARHGIRKGMSLAQLKKVRSSDSASPRKKQLAHWQINMRQGRKK